MTLFVAAYAVALLAAVLLGLRVKEVRGAERAEPLSHEEVGYLGGGPARAAEVAVAALVSENRAKFAGDRLAAVEPAEPADSPIGTVVLSLAGHRVDDVVRTTADSDAVRRLGHALLTQGFLVTPVRRLRRAIAAVLLLFLLGALLFVHGDWTPWTVGAGLLTAAAIVGLLATPPPVLTRAGSYALWAATIGLAPVEPAELTARYGLRRPAPPEPGKPRKVVQTATFDGQTVERIDTTEASESQLPRPRRSATPQDDPPPRRVVWAAGWFAGGWLASSWLGDADFSDIGDIFDA
ncbi:TIGR04222 domain-containing membrane protein [Lentzea tibetensis]|uniref:TIGR04222 domain-containing membrane protein n=1 Tax=Lentzea tibetensis TaxID=2591470 RepID=UPI001645350E|nr:TIGR04222 domain-containing membrane protein [Lentzea tibetensis]